MHAIALIGRHEGVGPNADLERADALWTVELETVTVLRSPLRQWVAGIAQVDNLRAFVGLACHDSEGSCVDGKYRDVSRPLEFCKPADSVNCIAHRLWAARVRAVDDLHT